MARIRTIKPSFFSSLSNSELPKTTRLTFIGLWTYVDDKGRGVDDARLVKAAIWPLDDDYTTKKVEADLVKLEQADKIGRYEAGGRRFFAIKEWGHQRIDKPQRSVLPAAPWEEDSQNFPGTLPPPDKNGPGTLPPKGGGEGNGREGKGSSSGKGTGEPDADEDEEDVKISQAARLVADKRLEARNRKAEEPVAMPDAWLTKTAVGVMPEIRALAQGHPEASAPELAMLATASAKPMFKKPEADPMPASHKPFGKPDCDTCGGSGWYIPNDSPDVVSRCKCNPDRLRVAQ